MFRYLKTVARLGRTLGGHTFPSYAAGSRTEPLCARRTMLPPRPHDLGRLFASIAGYSDDKMAWSTDL